MGSGRVRISLDRPRVMVLLGPTAIGKTSLLERVSEQLQPFGVEIINADSRQVYRGMDIGTAKPSARQQGLIPHHLIDIIEPSMQFTAGEFVRAADQLVVDIHQRNGNAMIVGGAAFYLWSFLYGLSSAPPADTTIRTRLKQRSRNEGSEVLYSELHEHDPCYAGQLDASDTNRIIRALEVFQLTGKPLSSFKRPETLRTDYRLLIARLHLERSILYARINQRVDQMFSNGLVAEVDQLRVCGYHSDTPGLRTIGYAEFFSNLSADQVRQLVQRNTRRFAKRQLTFFDRFQNVQIISADNLQDLVCAATNFYKN